METKRIECPHCESKGTYLIDDGHSCGTCLKKANITENSRIVKCEVCDGAGSFEPFTTRLKVRMPFIIVMVVLILFYIYATVNVMDETKFEKVFPVLASLTTMIVTFYFSRK